MNKIILKSLELAGFKNASEIAEVIAATPNPQVAAEIILGVYEPVSAEDFGSYWKHKYSDTIYQVMSVDELHDVITCYKHTQATELFYYLTSEDYNSKTNRVAKQDKQDGVKYYDYRSEAVPGVTTNPETFKREKFDDSMKAMTYGEFVAVLDKWDPYEHAPEPEMAELADNLPF